MGRMKSCYITSLSFILKVSKAGVGNLRGAPSVIQSLRAAARSLNFGPRNQSKIAAHAVYLSESAVASLRRGILKVES